MKYRGVKQSENNVVTITKVVFALSMEKKISFYHPFQNKNSQFHFVFLKSFSKRKKFKWNGNFCF